MIKYLARKLLSLPPTVLLAITITFLILRLTPGDPVQIILGDLGTPDAIAAMKARLGLDQPLLIQYWTYMKSFLTGDLGYSIKTGAPIFQQIIGAFPHTLRLAVSSLLIAILVGLSLGVISALYRGKLVDRVAMVITLLGVSCPIFVIGFLLLLYFSYYRGIFPLIGVGNAAIRGDITMHLILPAVTLGLSSGAIIARVSRSNMLDVLGEDYIRTARFKGLPERIVIGRHAIRNAFAGIISIVGLQFSILLGGAVITEAVFTRIGMGTLLIDAIRFRDYPMVQGIIAVFITIVILINLITDILFGVVDPRLRK